MRTHRGHSQPPHRLVGNSCVMPFVPPFSRSRGVATGLVTIGVTVSAVFGLLAVLLLVTGHDPGRALHAFWMGSFGSPYTFASATLVRATPLILAGLAIAIA